MHEKPSNKLIVSSVIFLLVLILALNNINQNTYGFILNTNVSSKLNYIPHAPINIDSDDDFGTSGYDFLGIGLISDPYRIANLSITAGVDYGIKISGTSVYFVIENCYIEGSIGTAHGISILNIPPGRTFIKNNTCVNWIYGIYLQQSEQSIIRNNTIIDSAQGIWSDNSHQSIIEYNTCSNTMVGIASVNDNNIVINGNTLQDNLVGLSVYNVPTSNVSNNVLINNGLYLAISSEDDYLTLTFFNNTANNLPITLMVNIEDTNIEASNHGQLILINCTNVVVDTMNPFSTIFGVHQFYCTGCTITQLNCMNNLYCILAKHSPETTVDNNVCSNTYFNPGDLNIDGFGIHIYYSNKSVVENNECKNYEAGIYVSKSFDVEIRSNTFKENEMGIATWTSDLTIRNNIIQDNDEGIVIYAGSTLGSNIIIKYNTIKQNLLYGVTLNGNSQNNIMHHNNFEDNNLGGTSQALDDGTNNIWYDDTVEEGNFWSDWSGSGPYSIDGTAGSVDPHPLSSSSVPEFNSWSLFILLSLIPILVLPIVRKKKN